MGQVEPQQKVIAVPPISADGNLDDIHPMRRGGVKSFVDDLVLGRGVVISRAATSLRSVETQPLTRRFVRIQTNDISARVKCISPSSFDVESSQSTGGIALLLRSPPSLVSPCLLSLSVYVFYVFYVFECLCVSLCVGVSPTNSRDVCVCFFVSLIQPASLGSASVSRFEPCPGLI